MAGDAKSYTTYTLHPSLMENGKKSSILGRDIFIAGAAWLAPSYFGKLITQRRRHGNVQNELKNNTDIAFRIFLPRKKYALFYSPHSIPFASYLLMTNMKLF
jgi:hypothetical protein